MLGVWCVGAPVRDHTGRSVAAISLSTIKEFFEPATSGPLVLRAAVEISRGDGLGRRRVDALRPDRRLERCSSLGDARSEDGRR